MTAASKVLDRLTGVRPTAGDRWVASCPTSAHTHGDRSRGLSVRDADDRVLIHCHAGCGAVDIVEALGLTLADLYEAPLRDSSTAVRSSIPARDLLALLDHEITVAVLILDEVTQRRRVSETQVQRLIKAAARIGKARDMVNPLTGNRHAA